MTDQAWPAEAGAVAVAIIRRRSGRYFAIAEPAVQDGPDVEITPHCFRLIEAALRLWPGSPVDIYRDEWAHLVPGAVSSRRIVGPSSRKAGAGPTQGVVYRSRTQGISPELNQLCEAWMHAVGSAKDAAKAAYQRAQEASR